MSVRSIVCLCLLLSVIVRYCLSLSDFAKLRHIFCATKFRPSNWADFQHELREFRCEVTTVWIVVENLRTDLNRSKQISNDLKRCREVTTFSLRFSNKSRKKTQKKSTPDEYLMTHQGTHQALCR